MIATRQKKLSLDSSSLTSIKSFSSFKGNSDKTVVSVSKPKELSKSVCLVSNKSPPCSQPRNAQPKSSDTLTNKAKSLTPKSTSPNLKTPPSSQAKPLGRSSISIVKKSPTSSTDSGNNAKHVLPQKSSAKPQLKHIPCGSGTSKNTDKAKSSINPGKSTKKSPLVQPFTQFKSPAKDMASPQYVGSVLLKKNQKGASAASLSPKEHNAKLTNMPVSSNTILSFDENNDRFALIHWLIDGKYSVVSINDVFEHKDEISIDETYDVKYGQEIFKGIIKNLGTKKDMIELEKVVSDYKMNSTPKKRKINSEAEPQPECSKENEEINHLKKIILDLESMVKAKDLKINQLERQIQTQKAVIDDNKKMFKPDDIGNLMKASISFFRVFGTRQDFNNLVISDTNEEITFLSEKYPCVTVSMFFKSEIENYLNDQTKSTTCCFRRLIGNLIPNVQDWSVRNGRKMMIDYSDTIHACFEYIIMFRSAFTFSELKALLRQICNESRRSVSKKIVEIDKNSGFSSPCSSLSSIRNGDPSDIYDMEESSQSNTEHSDDDYKVDDYEDDDYEDDDYSSDEDSLPELL